MRVVEQTHAVPQIVFDEGFHLSAKGTGITDRRPLPDTRRESYRVRASFHQLPCPQYGLLSRTAAAIREAYNFYILGNLRKDAGLVAYGVEVARPRTEVLGLHASDDSKSHNLSF